REDRDSSRLRYATPGPPAAPRPRGERRGDCRQNRSGTLDDSPRTLVKFLQGGSQENPDLAIPGPEGVPVASAEPCSALVGAGLAPAEASWPPYAAHGAARSYHVRTCGC